MADENRIKLGVDAREAVYQLDTLASKFDGVKVSAQAVAGAYDLVDAEAAAFEAQMRSVVDWSDRAEGASEELAGSFAVLAQRTKDLRHEAIPLADAVRDAGETYELASRHSHNLSESHQVLASASGRAAAAVSSTDNRLGAMSRSALQASQALQDVAQGGIASGLNNVDGIVNNLAVSLGYTATAAATASAAILGIGTFALIAAPAIAGLYRDMTAYGGSLPPATDELARLNDELRVHKERIDEIRKRDGQLSTQDIEDYAEAQRKLLTVESDLATRRESSAVEQGLRATATDAELADRAKQAKRVREAVAAQQDELIDVVRQKAADHDKAVIEARERLARADEARRDFMSSPANIIMHPFQAGELVKGVQEAEKELAAAMRHAGLEGMKALRDAFAGENEALKKIIEIVGPDSDLAQGLKKGLREVWQPEEALQGMAERGAKVIGDFVKNFKEKTAEALAAEQEDDRLNKAAEQFYWSQKATWEARLEQFTNDVEAKAKESQAKINAALAKIGPDPFEGIESFEDMAMAFDDEGNRVELPHERAARMEEESRLAGVRRRSGLRKPVRQVAESFGMDLSPDQLAEAAGMVDFGRSQGMEQGDAIAAVLEQLMINQQMLADQRNADGGRVDRVLQGARRVPSLLEYGQW
jgi:hypothetical protein